MEEPALPEPSSIEVARRLAALGGLVALTLSIAAWDYRPDLFWHAYSFAWLLTAGASLGVLVLALLGRIRRFDAGTAAVLRAGAGTAYLVLVLAAPLALGASDALPALRAQPLPMAYVRFTIGSLLAALSIVLATLAGLARREPTVLTRAGERVLRLGLAAALVIDGLTLRHGPGAALAELALALWLVLPRPYRAPLACGLLAFGVHALRVRLLAAPGTMMTGDPRWLPYAMDLLLVVALGGLWLALFLWRLDRRPPPPLQPFVEPQAPA